MEYYLYSVWFEDKKLDKDDQDKQWVACFLINSENSLSAKSWGDIISEKYLENNRDNNFLSSDIEELNSSNTENVSMLPKIEYGFYPSQEYIGW